MGAALAGALLEAGTPLTVWNRSAGRRDAFASRATIAGSAAEACACADVILVSLSDYSAGLEVLDAAAAATSLEGKILLQMTSGTASDARTMAAWAAMHDMAYLDAAIVAYPDAVGSAEALLLYAGDEDVFERVRELVAPLGGVQRFVGESIGAAAAYDCAVLDYYYGATAAMLHGAAMVDSENLPLREYFYLAKALAPLLSVTADGSREMIARDQFAGSGCALDVHVGALRHIQRMSHDNGIDTRVPDTIVAAYKKAVAAGHGDDEIAALFNTLRHT